MTCASKTDYQSFVFPELPKPVQKAFFKGVLAWRQQFPHTTCSGDLVTCFSFSDLDTKIALTLVPLLASAGLMTPKIIWPSQTVGGLAQNTFHAISGFKLAIGSDEMQSALMSSGGVFACAPETIKAYHSRLASSVRSKWQLFSLTSLLTLQGLRAKSALYDIKINDSSPDFDIHKARKLAMVLKAHSDQLGIQTSYFLRSMPQPLGRALGPVLEVIEACEILKGRGPLDMKKFVLEQAADLLLNQKAANRTAAKTKLKSLILSGDALRAFSNIIHTQYGQSRIVNDYSLLPRTNHKIAVCARKEGFVTHMKMSSLHALRERLSSLHPGAGVILQVNFGEPVKKGDLLAEIHYPEPRCSSRIQEEIHMAIGLGNHPPRFEPLIAEKIMGNF